MINFFNTFLLILLSSVLEVGGQKVVVKSGYGRLMFGQKPATSAIIDLYRNDTGIDKLIKKVVVNKEGNFTFVIKEHGVNKNEYYIRILENDKKKNKNFYYETIIPLPNNVSSFDYVGGLAIYNFGIIDLNIKPIHVFNKNYNSSKINTTNPNIFQLIHTFFKKTLYAFLNHITKLNDGISEENISILGKIYKRWRNDQNMNSKKTNQTVLTSKNNLSKNTLNFSNFKKVSNKKIFTNNTAPVQKFFSWFRKKDNGKKKSNSTLSSSTNENTALLSNSN